MVSSQIRSTACRVELVTPDRIRLVFDSSNAQSDLVHVSTHNDMAESCGSFQLTFAPRRIQGRTYDQLIPLRTLVTISMTGPTRVGQDEMDVVMVGLTEDHGKTEDYTRAGPQCVVTISGRSMAGVLLDMQLRHFPGLENTQEGTLTVGDHYFNLFIPTDFTTENMDPRDAIRAVLTYFLGVKSHQPALFNTRHLETQQAAQQRLARLPDAAPEALVQQVAREQQMHLPSPSSTTITRPLPPMSHEAWLGIADDMRTFDATYPGATQGERDTQLRKLTEQAKAQIPGGAVLPSPVSPTPPPPPAITPQQVVQAHNVLLNLQLPDRPLADLLDLNDDTWTMFDEDVRMPVGHNTPYASSLWNYLQQFIDPVFQEFFTRVENGVVKIVFRGKPFLDEATFTGTRFVETSSTCRTMDFTREAWDAQYLGGQERRQTSNVYNAFTVLPLGAALMWQHPSAALIFNPLFVSEPEHPSYLPKFGLRILYDESPYISTKKLGAVDPTQDDIGHLTRISREWGKKAKTWHELGSEMYAGLFTVLGDPTWNIGHRLLYADERGLREGYLEGVSHQYSFQTGHYTTQLRVTRLWYLSGLVDERGPAGGGTITQEVIDTHVD